MDPKIAWGSKLLVLVALLYVVFPVDLLPDVVPILGWLDDLGMMTVAFALLTRAFVRYSALESPASDATAPHELGSPPNHR